MRAPGGRGAAPRALPCVPPSSNLRNRHHVDVEESPGLEGVRINEEFVLQVLRSSGARVAAVSGSSAGSSRLRRHLRRHPGEIGRSLLRSSVHQTTSSSGFTVAIAAAEVAVALTTLLPDGHYEWPQISAVDDVQQAAAQRLNGFRLTDGH